MFQWSGRIPLVAILFAVLTTTAAADPGGQNDAGSGTDAGDTRDAALVVQANTPYLNNKLRQEDVDWYAADFPPPGAACVRARVVASTSTYFALGAESSALTLSAPFVAEPFVESTAGIAGATPLAATLRAAQVSTGGMGKYNFTLERVALPAGPGLDGGVAADAGDGPSTATPARAGCISGSLPTIDIADTYSIAVPSGQIVTYSLASSNTALRVQLLDAIGNAVGPVIGPGEVASVPTMSSGTYLLSASRASTLSETNYVIGAIVGPEPGACRPFCMS